MKHLHASLFAVALALASVGARADKVNFSYSFDPANTGDGNPVVISGSFDGTLSNGAYTGITGMQVSLNGTAFSGPLFIEAFDSITNNWSTTLAPVISSNVAQANFIVADTDVSTDPSGASNYFYISGGQALALTFNATDAGNNPLTGYETASNANWSLAAVAAVPEPQGDALMLAGLASLGLFVRMRRQR